MKQLFLIWITLCCLVCPEARPQSVCVESRPQSVCLECHGPQPVEVVDFPFVTRDGEATTLFAEISRLSSRLSCPPVQGNLCLLLFDPDCDECHTLIDSLKTLSDLWVIAVYPVDEPLAEDDPNLLAYRRACAELPDNWVVGIDNGSILDGDLYQWEHLPLLLPLSSAGLEAGFPLVSTSGLEAGFPLISTAGTPDREAVYVPAMPGFSCFANDAN